MLDKLLVSDTPDFSIEGDVDTHLGSSHADRSEIHGEATSRSAILTAIGDRYYALSASCALFKCVALRSIAIAVCSSSSRYLERINNRAFASRSLRIRYAAPEGALRL